VTSVLAAPHAVREIGDGKQAMTGFELSLMRGGERAA
jgi:hypothetical protein